MKYPKRRQYKYAKSPYRIRNWPEYEAGLRNRGDLTVWLSDAALDAWRAPASGKTGGQRTYSDLAIEAALTIRMVFHLPLRQTEGFLRSMRKLGRREWFANSGCGERSLVENTVFRYKTILGQRMRSRSLDRQRVEVGLACKILNTMTSLGRPDSVNVG
jgi:hypothetical protein